MTELCKCISCDYRWQPRGKTKPKACPQCKTYRWEKKTNNIHK